MIPPKYIMPVTKPNQSDSFQSEFRIANKIGTSANQESIDRLNSGNPKTNNIPENIANKYLCILFNIYFFLSQWLYINVICP